MEIWPGTAYPLGATYDGSGVNFALFSEVAERVELCLIDDDGAETRLDLPEVDGFVWHAYVPGVQPGQRYGFRVHGPYDPEHGHRCNPSKLLLDPYAKAIEGEVTNDRRCSPTTSRTRRSDNTDDNLGKHDAVGGHQPLLRLGPRPAAAARVPRDGHLRGPRQGHDR